MGLHEWYIVSKNAEEKKIRTNYKRLGCLFEAFLGALFLDFNKIEISDENGWFDSVFTTGPGFQIAQIFVENIFEKHIDWTDLIQNDDNYKNIFQVIIQKRFKATPQYLLISKDEETGIYTVGLYLVLNIPVQDVKHENALSLNDVVEKERQLIFNGMVSEEDIKKYGGVYNTIDLVSSSYERNGSLFVCVAQSSHKIKKKAEQDCCRQGIMYLA